MLKYKSIYIEVARAEFEGKKTWPYPHEFFSFFGGFVDLPFLVASFLKIFSILLFQGVLYFPVKAKAKERFILEANRKARGLMDRQWIVAAG